MESSTIDQTLPAELPLVGRKEELDDLHSHMQVDASGPAVLFLTGDGGVGKSRLVRATLAEAERRNWRIAFGQAYPVESGIPYALFGDAFLPLLRGLEEGALSTLTRGGESELRYLFPALAAGSAGDVTPDWSDPSEFRTRLLWNFTGFTQRYAAREPLLIVLEDLHWADESSLQLLHFVARQSAGHPIRFIGTYTDEFRDRNPSLVETETSLLAQGTARRSSLEPLSRSGTAELVRTTFHVGGGVSEGFSERLHDWTHGNPFFIEETLKNLVETGRLHIRRGVWLGWEARQMELPRSIRDGIRSRVSRLSPDARTVADHAAVIGGPATHELLTRLSGLDPGSFIAATEELTGQRILVESADGASIVYDFLHPMIRHTLYTELGLARARLHHTAVAESMEALYGDEAGEHVNALAYHFARAASSDHAIKSAHYLAQAGRDALARHAYAEAGNYLAAALETTEKLADPADGPEEGLSASECGRLVVDLARARQRQGRYEDALALWQRALAGAEGEGPAARTDILRHMALLCYWSGRYGEALAHLEAGLDALGEGEPVRRGVLRLTRGVCLQELGRPEEAQEDIEGALAAAESTGAVPLLARAHRALALLHTWTGPSDKGRDHARRAIILARECGDLNVAFWSRWALASLEGLTGDTVEMARQIERAERIADELRSPVLRIWTAEISIERAAATGEWETGIALGERAIALARSLNQTPLLPRLLVWTALIYLGRGSVDRGKELVDEAWELATTRGAGDVPLDVHTAVPAHIGRVAYHVATENWDEAIRFGEAGLAIAERSGYVIWSIHHLLPLTAEAYLQKRDLEQTARLGKQLRRDAERLDHLLGLAWADAADALVIWLSGDSERGAVLLRKAAEGLEKIPMIPDATRLRRQLAGRLADLGDREGALQELRRVHETLAHLGAQAELEKTRIQFKELGARPPSRVIAAGEGDLTGREIEIARLVADRKSNKAAARALGISARTVSTHLSNIYRKLGLASRGELADMVREGRLP